jgi:uncharacterized protein (TIGR02217 family)
MFIERRFFDDVRPQASGGPEYRTIVKSLRNGAEHRNSLWVDPLRSFSASLVPRDRESVKEVLNFAVEARGAANGFRIRDWSDFSAEDETIGFGDGNTYWFRMVRAYGAYSRRILKPVASTVQVRLAGTLLSPSLYAVDAANGLIIFKFAPGTGVPITANFEFDVPVRFTEDALKIMMLFYKTGTSESIEFREIRMREEIDLTAINNIRSSL